jgi:hypothetical protein
MRFRIFQSRLPLTLGTMETAFLSDGIGAPIKMLDTDA